MLARCREGRWFFLDKATDKLLSGKGGLGGDEALKYLNGGDK
jgi:hypothetical protein